jgi:cytochrome P450
LVDQYTRPKPGITYDQVWRQLVEYLQPLIDERRGKAGTDIHSHIINGQVDGRELTNEETLSMTFNVLIAGLDTVVNFMGFTMLFLARNPTARHELAADLGRVSTSMQELLRRFSLVCIAREVTCDLDFEGVQLKRGEMMLVPTLLHALDSRENPVPMTVNFKRPSLSHSLFGAGIHACAGMHLARTEVRIMLEEWLTRIPEFSIDPASEIHYIGGNVIGVSPFSLIWDVSSTRKVGV